MIALINLSTHGSDTRHKSTLESTKALRLTLCHLSVIIDQMLLERVFAFSFSFFFQGIVAS